MAHFAKLDENNVVIEIIVIDNDLAITEQQGINYIKNVLKLDGVWLQTSYNSNVRGKFAAINNIYDAKKDEFIVDEKRVKEKQNLLTEQEKNAQAKEERRKQTLDKLGLTAEELSNLIT